MNRIEACIFAVGVSILAGCVPSNVPMENLACPKGRINEGCSNDRPGARNVPDVARSSAVPAGPSVQRDSDGPRSGVDGPADIGGPVSDSPSPSVKGNASANNGKGGNYEKTGHADNGKGNGKGRL